MRGLFIFRALRYKGSLSLRGFGKFGCTLYISVLGELKIYAFVWFGGMLNVAYAYFKHCSFLRNSSGMRPDSARRLVHGLVLKAPKLMRHALWIMGSKVFSSVLAAALYTTDP